MDGGSVKIYGSEAMWLFGGSVTEGSQSLKVRV